MARRRRRIVAEPEDQETEVVTGQEEVVTGQEEVVTSPAENNEAPDPQVVERTARTVESEPVISKPTGESKPRSKRLEEQNEAIGGQLLQGMMESLEQGMWLVIGRSGANEWKVGMLDNLPFGNSQKKKTVGREYWDEVESDAYKVWHKEWSQLDYEEKVTVAVSLDIVEGKDWEDRGSPHANMMQIVPLVCEKKGIPKYKPEYETREARAVVREKARMGLL